jgi:hypothetical protein
MGMDFADELRALGHEVRTFEYRKDNALYEPRGKRFARDPRSGRRQLKKTLRAILGRRQVDV